MPKIFTFDHPNWTKMHSLYGSFVIIYEGYIGNNFFMEFISQEFNATSTGFPLFWNERFSKTDPFWT